MLENLFNNLVFNIICSSLAFGLYVTNCYILRIRKARLPYKIMLTGLLPWLNVTLLLMQICFFSYTFVNLLTTAINKLKVSKLVTKLGYPVTKPNTHINKVPKRA